MPRAKKKVSGSKTQGKSRAVKAATLDTSFQPLKVDERYRVGEDGIVFATMAAKADPYFRKSGITGLLGRVGASVGLLTEPRAMATIDGLEEEDRMIGKAAHISFPVKAGEYAQVAMVDVFGGLTNKSKYTWHIYYVRCAIA